MAGMPRLDSWKEIAHYLGRDVRTVIRWEERGLPVHRIPGGKISRVFAFPDELDEWLRTGPANGYAAPLSQDPTAPAPPATANRAGHVGGLVVALAGVAALVLIAARTRIGPDPVPRRLEVSGGQLLAYDAGSSRPLWAKRLDEGHMSTSWGRWHAIQDLDDDGRDEILTAVQVHQRNSTEHAGVLSRLAADGREDWSLRITDRLRFGKNEYGPPWPTDDFVVYRADGETRIAWLVHQFTWWPGLLVSVNAKGERRGIFVNSGWLRAVQPSVDGRYLFVSGISNSRRAYILAVLDARRPTGRSPEPSGAETECVSCPAGEPLHYIVLPRTEVGQTQPFPANGPSIQTFEDGSVQVQTHESDAGPIATVVFTFTPNATLQGMQFNDAYLERHRHLEAIGGLTHTDLDCPERRGLVAQHWTPVSGWRQARVAAQ